jgi:hypothetical protein
MPRRDFLHIVVRRALINDGWTITHDPLTIKYKGLRVFIDLAAEKASPDAASGRDARVAIEVKVFGGRSGVNDFEKAVGQYSLYRDLLARTKSTRELFLAVSRGVYEGFFQIPAIQEYIAAHRIQLLIFDSEREEVVEWIRQKS